MAVSISMNWLTRQLCSYLDLEPRETRPTIILTNTDSYIIGMNIGAGPKGFCLSEHDPTRTPKGLKSVYIKNWPGTGVIAQG